jgi:hypothetical protein
MHATRKSARCWNGAISLTELSNSERNRPPHLAIVFRGDWLRVGLGVHAIAAQGLNKCASLDKQTLSTKRADSTFRMSQCLPRKSVGARRSSATRAMAAAPIPMQRSSGS